MSTFDGVIREFPQIRIDNFTRNGQPPLACFLSHVHSDHLRGLESFKSPFVYCSAATKELLLRLEKYPHRMNFAKGVLETRKQTYRHLKKLLRPIPLNTPTEVELSPGNTIRVTLYDANHCTGAVMFLIEGQDKAVLYTGDIRSEQWWIDLLARHPCLVPYAKGLKRLDNIYLDTTFASTADPHKVFLPKADGLSELLEKVAKYPDETVFYFNAWTFGYEEVWLALSHFLQSKIHLDAYRYRLFRSLGESSTCEPGEIAPLVGFQLGNSHHAGCVTKSDLDLRIHSCERGTQCNVFSDSESLGLCFIFSSMTSFAVLTGRAESVVNITPIVTRHAGVEYQELGAGGGHGDLDQIHELELNDISAVGSLMELCSKRLQDKPELLQKILAWLGKSVKQGGRDVRIDTARFFETLYGEEGLEALEDVPLDRLVNALEALVQEQAQHDAPQPRHIVSSAQYCPSCGSSY